MEQKLNLIYKENRFLS